MIFLYLNNLQNYIQMLNFYRHWNVFWGLKCSLFLSRFKWYSY